MKLDLYAILGVASTAETKDVSIFFFLAEVHDGIATHDEVQLILFCRRTSSHSSAICHREMVTVLQTHLASVMSVTKRIKELLHSVFPRDCSLRSPFIVKFLRKNEFEKTES